MFIMRSALVLGLAGIAAFGSSYWPPIQAIRWSVFSLVVALILDEMACHLSKAGRGLQIAALVSIVLGGAWAGWKVTVSLIAWTKFWWQYASRHYVGFKVHVGTVNLLLEDLPRVFPFLATWTTCAILLLMWSLVRFNDHFLSSRVISKNAPWRGGFLSGRALNRLIANRQGLPLGTLGGKVVRYRQNREKGMPGGHSAIIAGTRAGKSVSCIQPAILDHEGPVVALDVKGELVRTCGAFRSSLGRKVCALNPFGLYGVKSSYFNPLDWVRRGPDMHRDIQAIGDGVIIEEPGSNAHFSQVARGMVCAATHVVISQYRTGDPRRSLVFVRDLLMDGDSNRTLESWAADPAKFGEFPSKQAAMFLALGDRESGGVKSTLSKNFEWLADPRVQRMLSRSSFSLDAVLEDALDLFICVPLDLLHQQRCFLRMMANLLLVTVMRQDGKRIVKAPICLILDEFTRLGRMEQISNIATVGAGSGIEAMFVAQNKDALDEVWGEEGASTLLASCATVRLFGLGRLDLRTAQWVEKSLPEKTVVTKSTGSTKSTSSSSRESAGVSRTLSEQKSPLLSAAEILELPLDRVLVLMRSQKPLVVGQINSFSHARYRSRLASNPGVAA